MVTFASALCASGRASNPPFRVHQRVHTVQQPQSSQIALEGKSRPRRPRASLRSDTPMARCCEQRFSPTSSSLSIPSRTLKTARASTNGTSRCPCRVQLPQVDSSESDLLHARQDVLQVRGWHAAPACEVAMDLQTVLGFRKKIGAVVGEPAPPSDDSVVGVFLFFFTTAFPQPLDNDAVFCVLAICRGVLHYESKPSCCPPSAAFPNHSVPAQLAAFVHHGGLLCLLPLDSNATASSVTRENMKTLNFKLKRKRQRITHSSWRACGFMLRS